MQNFGGHNGQHPEAGVVVKTISTAWNSQKETLRLDDRSMGEVCRHTHTAMSSQLSCWPVAAAVTGSNGPAYPFVGQVDGGGEAEMVAPTTRRGESGR